MGIFQSLAKLNVFIEGKEKDAVFLDLGSRYIKGIVKEQNKIKQIFAEDAGTDHAKNVVTVLKKHRLTGAGVSLCVKGPDAIMRYIPFPRMEKKNLKQSFSFELSKHIPFPADTVYFDVCIVEEEFSKTESLVLLAAVKKEMLTPIIEEAAREKIKLSEITLSPLSLINAFLAWAAPANNCAIVDIGYGSTSLSLVKKTMPYLSREIKVSGKSLLKKLSTIKNCDTTAAEKILISGENGEETAEIGEEIFLGIAEEIRSSLDYFEMNTGEQINHLYLSGGFSGLPGVEKIVASSLGIEAKPWKPWEKLNLPFPQKSLPPDMFSAVLGLIV